jgi:hypothetical protein
MRKLEHNALSPTPHQEISGLRLEARENLLK